MMSVNVGDRVKDRITGLSGIVICRSEWQFGCIRVTIQPETSKDGKPADVFTIDEPQTQVVVRGAISDDRELETKRLFSAGPRADQAQRESPPR